MPGVRRAVEPEGFPAIFKQARAMRFSSPIIAPQEARLGRLASAGLSGSVVLLGGFFLFVGASVLNMWLTASAAATVFAAYLIQVHYLSTIGRHPAKRRLLTWQLSLAVHCIVFAFCYFLVGDSVVFVFLIPEALSMLIHLAGIRHALKARESARPANLI
jgi:dolichol kinase